MTSVPYTFTKFPWFNGNRRPVLIGGDAICKLIHIQEGAPGNAPTLRWVVESVECDVAAKAKRMKNFNGKTADLEDFRRWLTGVHGRAIDKALLKAHAEAMAEPVEE